MPSDLVTNNPWLLPHDRPQNRPYAAALGRRYFEGTVTFEVLMEQLGDSEDPLILALVQAIQHEPKRGFMGVSQERWERTFRSLSDWRQRRR
jgi:hypothetical protein